jgi:hypothetical protein
MKLELDYIPFVMYYYIPARVEQMRNNHSP